MSETIFGQERPGMPADDKDKARQHFMLPGVGAT